jgi:group I intron endonuclease
MKSGIYTITCLANNKIYVGSTTRLFCQRWGDHKAMLNKGKHTNIHLQRAWNKYGSEAFVFEILELCDKEFILSIEQYWINMLDSYSKGFNRNPNARNSYGIKRSAETCKKIGETLNYKKANAAWEGSKHSEETKQIIKHKRSKQVMIPWSEERKAKHSIRMKGKAIGNINQSKYFSIIAEKDGEVLRFKNTHEAKKYFGLKRVDGITRVLRKERSMYMGYTWRVEMP